ncbi:MAG: hypothetical protein AB1483_00505 [Candidatus Zixiibacteriota bacterium]
MIDGWSYYTTPYTDRPHHPDYRSLRPAGSTGVVLGIVGATMMLLMLVYSLQKRLRLFGRRTPLRPFLDGHIFLGVIGPLMIIMHTSFKVQGLVAIAFWAMIAVALSGYFGRYLYQQIPRTIDDKELSLTEIELSLDNALNEIRVRSGLDEEVLEDVLAKIERVYFAESTRVYKLLPILIVRDIIRPWSKHRLRHTLSVSGHIPPQEVKTLTELGGKRALLKRRLHILGRVQRMFHWWHIIHKPLAIIMYVIMIVHITVAVWTGYAW